MVTIYQIAEITDKNNNPKSDMWSLIRLDHLIDISENIIVGNRLFAPYRTQSVQDPLYGKAILTSTVEDVKYYDNMDVDVITENSIYKLEYIGETVI